MPAKNSSRLVYSVRSVSPGSKLGIRCHGRWDADPAEDPCPDVGSEPDVSGMMPHSQSKFPRINSFPGSTETRFAEQTWPQISKFPEEHVAPLPMRNHHNWSESGSSGEGEDP
eukprot:s1533_g13.t1